MKTDIQEPGDIAVILQSFYEKIRNNILLSPFLQYVERDSCFSLMQSFWESILFATASFDGSPVEMYRYLQQRRPVTRLHFSTCLQLFDEAVNEYFSGENAAVMKLRAKNIAAVLLTGPGSQAQYQGNNTCP